MEAAGADGEGLGQTQKSESKCPRLSPHFVPCLKDAQDPPSYLLAFFSPHYSLTRPEGDLEYGSPSVLDRLKSLLSPTMPLALFGESCSSVGQETPNQPCGSHPFSSGFTAEDRALQSGLQPNWQVICSSLRRELEEVWDQCQPSSAGPGREK